MAAYIVRESNSAWVALTFQDRSGAAAAPSLVRYRIDCMTTGQPVRAWTVASGPAASMELAIAAADNAMRSPGNAQEIRRVTVEATYGSDADKLVDCVDYTVTNLSGV